MNSGQTMLVILAMVLLGTLSLSVNRTLINSSSTSLEMEANLDALSYGQSMLDEILNKSFDQFTVGGTRIYKFTDMTRPNKLGPETNFGEEINLPEKADSNGNFLSQTVYNDVDDYRGYSRIDSNIRLGNFTLSDSVQYVSENHPDSINTTMQTFCKRVTVVISSPFMTKDQNGNVFPLVMREIAIYRRYF